MSKNKKEDYVVLFSGAKLSKNEANKAGLGIILGVIGFIIALLIIGVQNRMPAFIVGIICTLLGYFVIGSKLFKKKQ
jgi:hypothetical protein